MSCDGEGNDAGGAGDDWFVPQRDQLSNCFGCGPTNEGGLRLRFRVVADGVETRVRLPKHTEGVDGVVHGGIQATILDEVMGVAAQRALPADSTAAPCVTAELSVRFLRPVPVDDELIARARVVTSRGRDLYVHGEIVTADGTELSTARARWQQLR